jgi:hypothetical protein
MKPTWYTFHSVYWESKAPTCFEHYLLILRRRFTNGIWYIECVKGQLAVARLQSCSSSGGNAQTAFGILRVYVSWLWHGAEGAPETAFGTLLAYNVNWLWHGCSETATVLQPTDIIRKQYTKCRLWSAFAVKLQPCHRQLKWYARITPNAVCAAPLQWNCNRATANWHYTHAVYQIAFVQRLCSETATVPQPTDIIRKQYAKCRLWSASWERASNARNM